MKIAFYDTKEYDKLWFEKLSKDYNCEILFFENKFVAETAILASGCDAVCLFVNDIIDEKAINVLYDLGIKTILLRCAGYDNVDLKAVKDKITVLRVPSYSPEAVAEYAMALLLTLNRKTHKAYTRTREFNFKISGLMGVTLKGKTAGVIGTGKIGRIMIEILKGFGMNILAYDPFPDTSLDINYVGFDELVKKSDVISLHCPLNADTKYIINKNTISKMKDGVILINTSRGGLVDTQALNTGLQEKKFRGVALDVYEEEEDYFFEDRSDDIITDTELIKLMSYPNVLITSHQAFFTEESLEAIARTSFENLKAAMEGAPLENEIKLAKQ